MSSYEDSREVHGFYVNAHYMYSLIYFCAPIPHMCIYAEVYSKASGGPLSFLLETEGLSLTWLSSSLQRVPEIGRSPCFNFLDLWGYRHIAPEHFLWVLGITHVCVRSGLTHDAISKPALYCPKGLENLWIVATLREQSPWIRGWGRGLTNGMSLRCGRNAGRFDIFSGPVGRARLQQDKSALSEVSASPQRHHLSRYSLELAELN